MVGRLVIYERGSAVKRLLQHGANPNVGNDYQNLLILAISYGYVGTVAALIECGADAKQRDSHGSLPLEIALTRSSQMISIIVKAIRRQDAKALLQGMLAMAPLQLPIYIYLDLADLALDFQDVKTGVGVAEDGYAYSAVLTEIEKINTIQGVMDSYRRVVRRRKEH